MILEKDFNDEGQNLEAEIEKIKVSLGISTPTSKLEGEELQSVIQKFGEKAPDTTYDENGAPVLGPEGMLAALQMTAHFIFQEF